jgi:outer membrane receptor protein involved in Fe transport
MKPTPISQAISLALLLAFATGTYAQDAPLPPDENAIELQVLEVEGASQAEEGGQFEALEVRRDSAQVLDVLSLEQISRAGDSDAAAALKRVTGLTLVEDRFVYVRGLGERYSSVSLNGAQIPSPDPTRKVIPLDLFPVDILSRVEVSKSYHSGLPGEFGGGALRLSTRGLPDGLLMRASATVGYSDGTTGEKGWRSQGGDRDWLGRDDGFRAGSAGLFVRPLPARGTPELAALGREVMGKGFTLEEKSLGPDGAVAFSLGQIFDRDEVRFGFIGSMRYSHGWDRREEERYEYAILGNGELVTREAYTRERTERDVDSSLFFSAGLDIGEQHKLKATVLNLAHSRGLDRIDQGLRINGMDERNTVIEWIQNELSTRQIDGEHRFGDFAVNWQYTDSKATRDMPDARSYKYSFNEVEYVYTSSFPAQMRWESLEDSVDEGRLEVSRAIGFGDADSLALSVGGSMLDRDRASEIWRYSVRHLVRPPLVATPIEDILNPGEIDAGRIELISASRATDFYDAEQSLDSYFLRADLKLGDWRADLGVRRERNNQRVITLDPFLPGATPIVASIERKDMLPAAAFIWGYSDNAQLRLAWNETLIRPDFRELSPAPYTDPTLDITVIGNPNLKQTDIRSLDLRWEYYFGGMDSLSIALFDKGFTHPIELVRSAASGDLLELRNAEGGYSRGLEIELSSSLGYFGDAGWMPEGLRNAVPWLDLMLSLNRSWIDSEVELGTATGIQTSSERPLQGQSSYVTNLALTWFDPSGVHEATLLYNRAGARLSRVGLSGVPDECEQPFDQLDFTYARSLGRAGNWKLKLRLRNLLDPEVLFIQGNEISRRYRKGREAAVTLEFKY